MTRPCEICGEPICEERIECLPDTRLCIVHSREIAKYGGEFILTGEQQNIGKAGSLKKNYGDISVHKSRNMDGLAKLRQDFESS